ncbi:hypothetical protein BKA62DRAFT_717287 [Auriculariales sp. MPI-PUGE-AT-0066]|nr:hypothetical protein BKA62DRAFT_717287 [Auriculariales sp. MPI-PUGE-AT-0066]
MKRFRRYITGKRPSTKSSHVEQTKSTTKRHSRNGVEQPSISTVNDSIEQPAPPPVPPPPPRTPELPNELVLNIMERAVHLHLEDDPKTIVGLQLLSIALRDWLLPMIYTVFVIETKWNHSKKHWREGTWRFFMYLLEHPEAAPRKHMKHIIFTGEMEDMADLETPPAELWPIETATLATNMTLKMLTATRLQPRKLWCSGLTYSLVTGADVCHRRTLARNGIAEFAEIVEVRALCKATGSYNNPGFNSWQLPSVMGVVGQITGNFKWDLELPPVTMRLHVSLETALNITREQNVASGVTLLTMFARVYPLSLILEMSTSTRTKLQYSAELLAALKDALKRQPAQRAKIRVIMLPEAGPEPPQNGLEYAARVRKGEEVWAVGLPLDEVPVPVVPPEPPRWPYY